jgi:hypothetical protein
VDLTRITSDSRSFPECGDYRRMADAFEVGHR